MQLEPFGRRPATEKNGRPTPSIRCPSCHERGTFETVLSEDAYNHPISHTERRAIGLRLCPATECHQLVAVVFGANNVVLAVWPAELREFDMTAVPAAVTACLDEALHCEAIGATRAASLMVRRTLEEICADRSATGANLFKRIESLGEQIVLPDGFVAAMHNLRFLGNDAGHVEARHYDKVGADELDAALDVTQVIVQATYQYQSTIGKLQALRADDAET